MQLSGLGVRVSSPSPTRPETEIAPGLGAYPEDPYFDPNRPSWLPYFFDTPTESASKWKTESTLGQMAGVVGYTVSNAANMAGSLVGSVGGGAASGLGAGLNLPGYLLLGGAALFAYLAANVPT